LDLSSSLSLFSSLQLDELELEDELEELELEYLEGPLLLLLGWRGETLTFALKVANEKEIAPRVVLGAAYIALLESTIALGSNRPRSMIIIDPERRWRADPRDAA
jgi:hypothetical protein